MQPAPAMTSTSTRAMARPSTAPPSSASASARITGCPSPPSPTAPPAATRWRWRWHDAAEPDLGVSVSTPQDDALRRVVAIVALLNLSYFGVEFAVALIIGSVSLFADSIDFLEDASINLLIFAALGWSVVKRAR